MMMLNDKATKIQTAYNLAAAVIVAADERDYWADVEECCGRAWADDMRYRCSNRIKYAVDKAREAGVYVEMLKITETLLMADEWMQLR